jgi:protein-S-isoprenylcysteine O-methyltransferase Ste14
MLAGLAGGMVILGILGWFHSKDLPSPWIVRLASTVMIVLGIAFLIWYFSIGRTLLHPIIDIPKIFESINESLITPAP